MAKVQQLGDGDTGLTVKPTGRVRNELPSGALFQIFNSGLGEFEQLSGRALNPTGSTLDVQFLGGSVIQTVDSRNKFPFVHFDFGGHVIDVAGVDVSTAYVFLNVGDTSSWIDAGPESFFDNRGVQGDRLELLPGACLALMRVALLKYTVLFYSDYREGALPHVDVAADYLILKADAGKVIRVDASAGPVTVTYPSTTNLTDGFHAVIRKTDTSSNPITVKRFGTNAVMTTLNYQYDDADFVWWASPGTWVPAPSPRTPQNRAGDFITPLQFGAVGDGVTDDAAAMNAASAAARALNRPLDGRGRTYKVNSNVVWPPRPWNMSIDIAAVTTTQGVTGTSDIYGLMIAGTDMWAPGYPVANLTVAGSKWDNTVTVDSVTASTVVAGDRVLIWQNTSWITGYTPPKKSEFNIVEAVDTGANTITFASPLRQAYAIGATVRRYGPEEADIRNITIIGGGAGKSQSGLLLANLRSVRWDNIRTFNCEKRGVALNNVFSFTGNSLEGDECTLQGFGYALSVSGAGNGYLASLTARHCRHAVTHGPSAGFGVLSRDISYGAVQSIGGTDAAFDVHGGTKNVRADSIVARGDLGTAYPVSDCVIFQGSGFSVDKIEVSGFARHGVILQPQGDGDGDAASYYIGNLRAHGDPTIGQYAFNYTDATAAAGEAPCTSIRIDTISAKSRFGAVIAPATNTVTQASIGSGYLEGTAGDAIKVNVTGTGALLEFDAGVAHYKAVAQNVLYPLDLRGSATNPIRKARADRATLEGGQYSVRVDYTTAIIPPPAEMFGSLLGTSLKGTGGTTFAVTLASV
jgi:hypothetical protein